MAMLLFHKWLLKYLRLSWMFIVKRNDEPERSVWQGKKIETNGTRVEEVLFTD
jgi:hypothetical protein